MSDREEYVEESGGSDEIIGRVFGWSLATLSLLGLALAAYWFWPRPKPILVRATQKTGEIKTLAAPQQNLPEIRFREVAAEAGIEFVHFSGANGDRLLPETMGGGVAIFDYDNNSWPDLLLISCQEWPEDAARPTTRKLSGSSLRLFANQGRWNFSDVTDSAGVNCQMFGMGCAVGDIDNDGWLDLFVTGVGGNRLFRNRQGKFELETDPAGLAGPPDAWSSSAGFFDYDRDGYLDLLVCNYVRWSREIDFELNFTMNGTDRAYGPPTHYEGTQPFLYRNRGDGTFEEVAASAGLHVMNANRPVAEGKALALVLADLNQDGWDDVLVANDKVRNYLFLNQRNGTFVEQGVVAGVAYDRAGLATGAMGIDLGHVFNDPTQAIAIGNFANEMTSVYVSQGDGSFVDEAASLGIGSPSRQRLKFGMLWADLDLDGRLDLIAANGHIDDRIASIQPSQTYRQPAQLFWNQGASSGLCFTELPPNRIGDLAQPIVGRGLASGDLDRDGDPDLVLTQIDGPPLVLANEQQTGRHFLQVQLEGVQSNRFGYGARVVVQMGNQQLTQYLSPTRSYLSQVEPLLCFGLGDSRKVDCLTVHWPSGKVSRVDEVAADQRLNLREPE